MGFRTDVRAAAATLLNGYAAANAGTIRNVYPGRPSAIMPPCAFVDAVNEGSIIWTAGPTIRSPAVDIILIQGLFDTGEATTAQDALVDGFLDYVRLNYSAAGAGTLVTIDRVDDIPSYVPEWQEFPATYYGTRVVLVGLKAEASLI